MKESDETPSVPPEPAEPPAAEDEAPTDRRTQRLRISILLVSTGLISVCAIIFELLIASLSTYLKGNGVYQFSITIGLYLSAMGLGSWLSQYVKTRLIQRFALIELWIGIVGGFVAVLLLAAFSVGWAYYVVMVALTLAIGVAVGFEIPLIVRIFKETSTLPVSVANVLAADYIGSLLGSLAFPLVLMIYFGLVTTSFLVGALNIAVAVVTVLYFRRRIPKASVIAGAGVVLGVGLAIAATQATSINASLEQALYRDPVEIARQSVHQRVVLTKGRVASHQPARRPDRKDAEGFHRRNPFVERTRYDHRLFLDGDLQFSSMDEYRYHEALVHPGMSYVLADTAQPDVLILGGGDGLAAREVLRYPEVRSVTLVDLDSAVVDLAREHPVLSDLNEGSLMDPKLEISFGDAFNYVLESKRLFDFIVVDLPDPDASSLSKLYSQTFYRMAKMHLSERGVLVSQSTSPFFVPHAFWCVHHTMRSAGLSVAPYSVYVPAFGLWGFNMATREPLEPAKLTLRVEGLSFLTNPVMRGLFDLPRDVQSLDVDVNTLDRPVIVSYYYGDATR